MIKEDFLHYLWKYNLFNTTNLLTTTNELIQIIHTGTHNFNAGPDFFNARLKINQQLWAGNVEIHVNSSDWYVHSHEKDEAYDSVILHVVWNHDFSIYRKDNTEMATLEIKNLISNDLLSNYQKLFYKNKQWINCGNGIKTIPKFELNNWLERLYIERLEEKSLKISKLLKKYDNDWEAVLFKLLAKNFGLKVNGEAFFNMSNSFDFSIFRKCQKDLVSLESLLFGQSSLLEDEIEGNYFNHLKKEYQFLKNKFKLESIAKNEVLFFRLRPNNFPTIRISQLANLFYLNKQLFSKTIKINNVNDYYHLFQVDTSSFWENHYSFKSESKKRKKIITKSFVDLLIINTILPLKFVYQKHLGKLTVEEILNVVKQLKSEKNSVIDQFSIIKINAANAFDSQALLQLKNKYCDKNKCLNCVVGNKLLKKEIKLLR